MAGPDENHPTRSAESAGFGTGSSYAGIADDTTWNFTAADETFSATQFAYSGNVSAADLLHGLTPVTTGWNTTNQGSPLELTDGIHGGAFQAVPGDQVQGAWTTVGATATYNLGTGPGGAGYNITSVQSIADWANVGFGNQAWTIEVKPVGGSYSTLATVNYQPLGVGDGIQNGVENFFGSDPGEFNRGLVAGAKTVNTFTFTNSQGTLAADLSASYRWSTDLATFRAGGASNGSTTVQFTTQPDKPALGITTVTATVIGAALEKLFVTASVTQN